MKRWDKNLKQYVENEEINRFIDEILAVCNKYNVSISHEDTQGSFIILDKNNETDSWISSAIINLKER